MEITIRDGEGCTLVRPRGVLTALDLQRLQDTLIAAAADAPAVLICDLRAVGAFEVDPSALAVLGTVVAQLSAWPACPLVVLAPADRIADLTAQGLARLPVVVDLRDVPGALADRPAPRRARLSLPAAVDAPARARAFLRESLTAWGLTEEDFLSLLIGMDELVTNAVVHARTAIDLVLTLHEDAVAAAVADLSDVRPRRREAGQWAENGRGLAMVDQLALRWGVSPRHGQGKTVWMVVARPS